MMRKKKKIVMPSEEDVTQYAGYAPSEAQSPPESQKSTDKETDTSEEEPSEAEQWKEKFLRAKAELANYQRRIEKDRAESLRYANAAFVKMLLPVLDDLERVIESGTEHPNAKAIVDGVELTLKKFLDILKDSKVERIEAEGQAFDPEVHEAMMEQPSDEHSDRTVLQDVAKGYRLHDRVLRPAKVIVSKPAEPEPDEQTETDEAVEETNEAGKKES